jgi:hypothetical protein
MVWMMHIDKLRFDMFLGVYKVWFLYGDDRSGELEHYCIVDAINEQQAIELAAIKINAVSDEGFVITGVEENDDV